MAGILSAHSGAELIGRDKLAEIATPKGSYSHKPIPHIEIVESLEKVLTEVKFSVRREEFAVSKDGMRMFGILDLSEELTPQTGMSIGIRNSNDKSMALGMTAGYRVFVCDNMAFSSDFQPIFSKHVHSMSVMDIAVLCVQRLQEATRAMELHIEEMIFRQVSDREVKEIIYDAFTSRSFGLPQSMFMTIHELYFKTNVFAISDAYKEAFGSRTLWSLSNAFTTAFKSLVPIQKFRCTAKLADFLREKI
jgi:hypothetical protein